jgi:thiamine biosynthesis lipoprotein
MEDPEAEIDLGGIAKGYIADRVAEELAKDKVTSAIISLGGNIECIGGKPSSDGASQIPFNIGIETPFSEMTQVTGSCKVTDGTLVTSGIYERFFEKDGVRYHHILDPKTGYPIENDVVGVTIRSSKGKSADCDALSTTCLILGVDKGMKLIEGLDGFDALFIDQDNQISKTSGMEFTPKN